MKSGLKTLNTARQNSSRAAVSVNTARPINTTYPKSTVNCTRPASNIFNRAHSHVRRPFNMFTSNKNNNLNEKVNTVKGNVTTVGPKVVVSDEANAVKASAWQFTARIAGKMRDPKGGRITSKGKISTGKLDFEDVYFVKELKFNLFSVSQMCDKKNNVLFTNTECVVLSPDFKLLDENHVLLRVPRTDNMYSVDLKNIVPSGDLKVKIIRCDNGTEFKNKVMTQFCEMKGIKWEFSVARTPQQNRVAERKNRTLIEAARTMLADSKLPTTFWDEAVNIACYIQNRVLVIKPHNKTPYELFLGRKPALSFMRPFGCPVTILNTIDHLGKFDGKADEGFFIGYSTNSKAFRVFNGRIRIVEENLHVKFSEETPNIAGNGPNWLFDIDALTKSMNYEPVVAGNQSNGSAGTKACDDAGKARMETVPGKDYILLPFLTRDLSFSSSSKDSPNAGFKPSEEEEKKDAKDLENEDSEMPNTKEPRVNQEQDANVNSTNNINTVSPTVNTASIKDNVVDENIVYGCIDDPNMPNLEEIIYSDDDEEVGAEADINNLATTVPVSPIPTTRVHKDHPLEQIIGDIHSAPQTRRMTKSVTEHVKTKKVWTLVDLPYGKRAIGTKWVYRNKKDDRGIVVRNKARLVAQGYTQEEGIDYDEVFAPVARIEEIKLFLAYASFMNFIVYQMDVKSAFLYGTIEEEVYVCQPSGFEDPEFPNKVYKVEKALYGLHQAPRAWYETLSTYLLENGFRRGTIDKTLFIKKYKDDAQEIPYEFYGGAHFLLRVGASTPMETNKALLKDEEAADVDVHLYRSMIGSLMYLTASRPDIMFAICACARFQVTPKTSHLYVVNRIFRYLKGNQQQEVVNFFGKRLISWQCKKQTIVANSTTEADLMGKRQIQLLVDKKEWRYENLYSKAYNSIKLISHPNENFSSIPYCNALSAKTTSWNEFSSTMASAIICLATNQKFNLSKYIFDNMVKNLDGGVKFLMYPRFVQVFLDKQVEGNVQAQRGLCYTSHTKNVFANMKRPCKGFSGRVTPLFSIIMVQATEDMGADSATPTDSFHTHYHLTIISKNLKVKQQRRKTKVRIVLLRALPTKRNYFLRKHVSTPSYDPPSSEVTLVNETQEMNDDNLMFDTCVLEEQEIGIEKVVEEPVVSVAEVVTTASASVEIPNDIDSAQTMFEIKTCKDPRLLLTVTSVDQRAKGIIFMIR
ncbi:putative ribonuclease H-like domain-containing protein [Tanacetum coccineum]|uniref:Ribonuclease H-like domain-containing protein n=1 Tax=Tanacetum coccineum TaxID=301880 RepID=A0ABQ5AJQ7_9ASTR